MSVRSWCVQWVCRAFRGTGIVRFLRYLLRRKASIVVYHNPERDVFEKHIEYITKHYNVISLSTLVDAVRENRWADLPPHSLVITFDDGHKKNHELLPLFVRHGVVPTIFLVSRIIESGNAFWWRVPASQSEVEMLKRIPNADRVRYLAGKYDYDGGDRAPDSLRGTSLTPADIQEMAGHVDFQSHTRSHPILTMCGDEEIHAEVTEAKAELEAALGTGVVHFAYPNGSYDERAVAALKNAGYRSARTTKWGWVDRKSDVYALKIVGVSDRGTVDRLVMDLVGIPLLCISILNKLRDLFRKDGASRI